MSVIKSDANNTKDSVMAAIGNFMTNMNKEHLINACNLFRCHTEAIIKAGGGYIE